jgi:hypothetical protein
MKLASALIAILSLQGCFPLPQNVEMPEDPQDGLPAALAATVVLADKDGSFCSGVVSEGFLFTAAHCDTAGMTVHFWDGANSYWAKGYAVKNLWLDEAQDLAIYSIQGDSLPDSAPLATSAPLWGRRVVVVGHPRGFVYTVTEGIVSHPSRIGAMHPLQHWTQISAPVFYGNSGGPVFNSSGEVVGIVSFMAGAPHLAGVVHLDELRAALHHVTHPA